ncbi:hypothetical protein ACKKIY_004064, partial [Salmonella enterica subsp. enterica serovar Brandenburg]
LTLLGGRLGPWSHSSLTLLGGRLGPEAHSVPQFAEDYLRLGFILFRYRVPLSQEKLILF